MPFTILTGDTFTSAGVGVRIPLPSSADYVRFWNVTQLSAASPTACVGGEWFGPKFGAGASPLNDGLRWKKAGSSAILIDKFSNSTAGDGFTYITVSPYVEAQAANAITAITAASPAVVSQTNTYSENDIVRIYNTTGMLQIAGMPFQISTVSGSGYTLIGLRAAGFAAAATAGNTRRISKFAAVDPEMLYITEITQAVQAVVRTSVDPSPYYVVGNKIHFSIPSSFGMTQMNQLTGTILAISATNYTLTVDIDSSAFTAFAFPASTASPTAQLFATLAPAGSKTAFDPVSLVQTGYEFQKTPFHTGQFTPYLFAAAGTNSPAGSAADQINWMAYKLEN
jgi:hypothetical protein